MIRTMCDMLLLNSVATNYPTTYKGESVTEILEILFTEHEAQLKAKESDLERQDMIIKCLNIDLDNKEKLLKAKDEEIKELGEIVQQCLIPSKNYDAIIKAKDDEIRRLNNLYADTIKDLGDALIEIERLKGKTQILEVLVINTKDIIEAQTRMCRTKARSIVAMLFWRARKDKRLADEENKFFTYDMALHSFIIFQKAYKMLKDNQ